ncbi:MAG: ParB/RepB/Spo0J family partition protein [Elusimicrobiota bacterium]
MKRALGRGLDSLIPEEASNEIKEIKIENIVPNKYQMRNDFNDEKIDGLAESIKEKNVVQPLIVTKSGRKYMLIAGERRWRAAKKAGLDSVPCIEREMDEEDYLTISLIENIQRENLSPVEEAAAYDRMIREFSMTQQSIAEKVGKSRSAVANTLRILTLPEDLRKLIEQGKMNAGHARALLSVKDARKRKSLAEKIVKESLTVREAEQLAAIASGKANRVPAQKKAFNADPEILKFEEVFEKALGTKVSIKMRNRKSGSINVNFYSLDEFERISDIICSR